LQSLQVKARLENIPILQEGEWLLEEQMIYLPIDDAIIFPTF
jgi:hypothetical protein